ncbi:hypothetical protein [Streptomyces sp. NPDC086519]|uniref:hypothetical protein n=1 Tax=Streptomyces sp. NPDC086519 TaxID=3154863 RepID=UPI00342FBBAC
MKNDVLKWAALAAALVATASAEYELARQVGFNQWVAGAVPGALDIYTVRAMRAHKDVLAAVVAMIGVNAASHLVTAGLLPVNVPLVVAVSAIAPLVLWRVHALRIEDAVDPQIVRVNLPETAEGHEVVRTPVEPEPYPALPEPVPAVPEAVPAGARLLPVFECPGELNRALRNEIRNETPAPVLAAEPPRTRVEVRVGDVPDWTVDGTYADESGDPGGPDEEPVYPDPLIPQVRADFGDQVPGVRRLKETYSIGQPRAQRIRNELMGVPS